MTLKHPKGPLERRTEGTMHAASNLKVHTESLSAKVTPAILAEVQNVAAAEGLKPGEWLRKLVTRELRGDSDTRAILAEIMDLRSIFLTLQTDAWRDVEFTEAQLREMVAKSGARKFAAADRVMLEAKQG
jgi:hypothetical protein